MFCVVGLGNPGKKYEKNRHNAGFLFIDWLAKKNVIPYQKHKNYIYAKATINNISFIFVKPQTYMNLSGIAVSQVLSFYNIEREKCLVIMDDVAIPFGKIRIRKNGSSGGHNGLKSIEQSIGSQNYPRIRIGIGKPDFQDLAYYVLNNFNEKELVILHEKLFPAIFDSIFLIESGNIEIAMSKYNGIDFDAN